MAEKQTLADSLRSEIVKLATDGDPKKENALTAEVLMRIVRVAKTGRDLIMSLEASPSNLSGLLRRPNNTFGMTAYPIMGGGDSMTDDGLSDSQSGSMPFSSAPMPENFGMVALRELIGIAKTHLGGGATSPAKLVEALVVAKANGLDDVVKELETQLGVGKEKSIIETAKPTEKGEPK